MIHIRHGFTGQRLVALPFYKIEEALLNPLTSDLVVHSMGYFPKASNHFIHREKGCGEYILIYCIKGSGWFKLEDTLYDVPENYFFILPADKTHEYGSSENNPWYIYWIHFKGKKAAAINLQLGEGAHFIALEDNSRINDRISLFDELLNILEGEMNESSITYANMSLNYLLSTFLYIKPFRDSKYVINKEKNSFFISRATHFMSENIEQKLTLSRLASHFGYSESYFYRLFLKETKYAPIDYFIHLKIERACQFLLNTNLKVNQISLKLGLEDSYYFSRIFKKIKGVSPKEFRKQNQPPI